MGHFMAIAKGIGLALSAATAAKSLTAEAPEMPKTEEIGKPAERIAESPEKRKIRLGLRGTIKTGFKGLGDTAPTSRTQPGGAPLKTTLGG